MLIQPFFYRLYLGHVTTMEPIKFLGCTFPITPDGGMLTCKHVVDIRYEKSSQRIMIYDNEMRKYVSVSKVTYSKNASADIAFLEKALQREKVEFIPMLKPKKILIGAKIFSHGHYSIGRHVKDVIPACFHGNIINFFVDEKSGIAGMTLSYPVIEGMSGSPILKTYNDVKVVGMCIGSMQQRIVASEVLEYSDNKEKFRETVNRIVEVGVGYQVATIEGFLKEIGVSDYIISDKHENIKGLEAK